MATHIKFRLKKFSNPKEVVNFIRTPQGKVSLAALGVASANLATNASRHRNDRSYQDKQIEAMDNLTRSIKGLDNTVKKKSDVKREESKPKFISFRPRLR